MQVVCLINVRPFDLDDAPVVLEMEEEVFNEPNPLLYAIIDTRPMEGFIVAECDGVMCGYIVGSLFMDESRILLLAVKEGYRRKGVGTRLVNTYVDSVSGRANMVRLEVRASNLSAQTFYFRLGFRFIGMIKSYYRNGDSAYLMVKPMESLTLFL